ncbi:MAG: hypothetical protein STHCBS139747_001972 [Sporothrix thermara]
MLTGKLTRRDYFTARDKLLGMGVRNVRSWTPMGLSLHSDRSVAGGLGASVPASDSTIQLPEEGMTSSETDLHTTTDGDSGFDSASANECKRVGLAAEAREYATSLDLDEDLLLRVDDLVRIGQRIIQASREISDEYDEDKVHYRDFLSESFHVVDTKAKTELVGDSVQVFVAEPTKLTITNFLGVQNTISIDYRKDLQRGLTFLVGDNGSGKSTIIEAMVWCQFGRCIRGGLAVNDVVNDKSGKNCSVKLEFANGYTIERFRKHKVYKNRVIVAFRGEPQHHLEHPDMRTTQAAINELLVHSEEAALVDLQRDIETSSSRLQSLKHEEKLSTERAIVMSEQLAQAVQARESLEILKQQALIKQHEVAIHKRLAEAENSSLHSLRSERDALATKLKETAADRELFFFWSAALAKRSSRVSSSTVPSSTAKTTSNLREHILVKSLSELNTLLAQVLTVLYDDTRHVHMASGMLRSLFEPESADDDDMMDNTTSSSGSVLGPTLAVHPSLAYSKRSSGERKRVNLALFFALLQLARARSAHRAQYVLVDEVFDNLDKAGQAAIVRWCRVMSQTAVVGCVVIITHSQYLVEQDPGEDANRAVIMRAVMGQRGTELSVDERSIGGV